MSTAVPVKTCALYRRRAAVRYLLRDEFTTAAAAPLSSPRSCEPGPGTITLVQTDGRFSISGGALQIEAQATPDQAGIGFYAGTVARQAGRFLAARMSRSALGNYYPYLGWGGSGENLPVSLNNVDLGIAFNDSGEFWTSGLSYVLPGPISSAKAQVGQAYSFALVLRGTGGFVLVQGGLFARWTLVFVTVSNLYGAAAMRPVMNTWSGPAATCDGLMVGDLPGSQWQLDYGIAVSRAAAPASGTTGTMQADGMVEFTWTVGAGETMEMSIRRTDDVNRWVLLCSQAGSTWALIEIAAGVETQRKTGAFTWTAAGVYRISITCQGLRYGVYFDNVWVDYYYDSAFNHAATGIKVSGFAAGANLIAWPLYVDLPLPIETVDHRIMTVGDSKTDYPTDWQRFLVAGLGAGWAESLRYARSGGTVASILALQAGSIARMPVVPEVILVNAGANDLAALPAAATWRADFGALLDGLHGKWPEAKVYAAKPWKAGQDASASTMAGWIDTVLSTRSSWALEGLNEAVTIKAGDNGAANTVDGIHYSEPAGNTAAAAAWKIAMGL